MSVRTSGSGGTKRGEEEQVGSSWQLHSGCWRWQLANISREHQNSMQSRCSKLFAACQAGRPPTRVLVDGQRGGGVLDEDVGQPHLECAPEGSAGSTKVGHVKRLAFPSRGQAFVACPGLVCLSSLLPKSGQHVRAAKTERVYEQPTGSASAGSCRGFFRASRAP